MQIHVAKTDPVSLITLYRTFYQTFGAEIYRVQTRLIMEQVSSWTLGLEMLTRLSKLACKIKNGIRTLAVLLAKHVGIQFLHGYKHIYLQSGLNPNSNMIMIHIRARLESNKHKGTRLTFKTWNLQGNKQEITLKSQNQSLIFLVSPFFLLFSCWSCSF